MALELMTGGSSALLAQLASAAARTLFVAGAAGVTLAALRVRSTSQRLLVWTLVLCAALAMPLLGRLIPPFSIPLPKIERAGGNESRPVPDSKQSISQAWRSGRKSEPAHHFEIVPPASSSSKTKVFQESRESSFWRSISWGAAARAIYFAGVVLLLARFLVGIALARRLVHTSQRIDDLCLAGSVAPNRRAGALPRIAESGMIAVPATVGVFRPAILLPQSWRTWDEAKLAAVIAHEQSHVARRDCLTHFLSLLHRAVFWFSPLSWWLNRHLSDLAEQASDEAVLSAGADSNHYARTLLGFLEALQAAPGRVWWEGVAMAKAGQAEQRVERILAWKGAVTMGLKKSVVVLYIAIALPVVYLAASARPAHSQQSAQEATPPPATAGPATPAPAEGVAAPAIAGAPAQATALNAIRAQAQAALMARDAAFAALAEQSHGSAYSSGHGYSYLSAYDDDERYVIVSGKTDSVTMSGSTQDARHAKQLKKRISGDFIWFQRDEKSYIIRDQATVDRAKSFWAPQEELGEKQEALGKQQEELGKKQEALGDRMEQVRVNVPDLTAELDRVKAKLKQLGSSATQDQLGDIQSEIGDLQSKIGEMQSQAGGQQSKLGEQMSALGEQQSKLGEQQSELGQQQEKLSEEASRRMKELLDDAIKKGTAQPEQPDSTL
jgi:beta-lactamase regulating signal transducer with metallopeptidase domain